MGGRETRFQKEFVVKARFDGRTDDLPDKAREASRNLRESIVELLAHCVQELPNLYYKRGGF